MAAMKKSKMKRKSGNGKAMATKLAAKKAPAKLPAIKEPLSKSIMLKTISDVTCLNKKDVVSVMDCFVQLIEKHVKTGGPGKFVLPGIMKIVIVKKPARSSRKGINPFTGEETVFKARPAYKAVKIKALKKLKEMVA
ncbi:MAG TPA: HU family DNA-binding protein [Gammaproteobacteria bacterium]|jgi:nucleoid DNA-binding protein|nr:HU family DNA-binding protein [Gammaproteobacteria bacterium]